MPSRNWHAQRSWLAPHTRDLPLCLSISAYTRPCRPPDRAWRGCAASSVASVRDMASSLHLHAMDSRVALGTALVWSIDPPKSS